MRMGFHSSTQPHDNYPRKEVSSTVDAAARDTRMPGPPSELAHITEALPVWQSENGDYYESCH